MTAAWQRKAQRELAAQLRAKDRARLAELRAELAVAKLARAARIRAIKGGARVELQRARERFLELLANLRGALKSARSVRQYIAPGARAISGAAVEREREAGGALVATALGALEQAASDQAQMRRDVASATRATRGRGRARASVAKLREQHAESADEVRGNLPPELQPVWDRMRRHITTPKPKMSLTETFLHWVHDNSQDVERLQNETLAADVAKLEREARELERAMRSTTRYRRTAGALAADVPAGITPAMEIAAIEDQRVRDERRRGRRKEAVPF